MKILIDKETVELARKAFEKTHYVLISAGLLDQVRLDENFTAAEALRQALEQSTEQKPVVWGVDWGKAGDIPCVSIIKRLPDGRIEVMAVEYAPYSYTSPPQPQEAAPRQWVGLTEKDKQIAFDDTQEGGGFWEFADAIEAKLKAKNSITGEKE